MNLTLLAAMATLPHSCSNNLLSSCSRLQLLTAVEGSPLEGMVETIRNISQAPTLETHKHLPATNSTLILTLRIRLRQGAASREERP
jgi:hypothetical protein